MENISEPYVIHYPRIVAVADEFAGRVELIEFFDCVGGAMWSKRHYAQSPIVEDVSCVGSTMRYMLRTGTVDLALEGSRFRPVFPPVLLTGRRSRLPISAWVAGVLVQRPAVPMQRGCCGAGVIRGGGKVAGSTLWLPRMQRVLIGVDDTDTPEEGATWTLVHNIARAVEDEQSIYLSHTIVQLFPVPYRTKNCVGLVAEFASSDPEGLVSRFHQLLEKYTLSKKTGMAVYTGFTPSEELLAYGRKVKRGEVEVGLLSSIRDPHLRIIMNGRGIVGAVAAIPFFTKYEEALELCSGKN